jgi:Putative porin
MSAKSRRIAAVVAFVCALSQSAVAADSQEERKLNELRNTVVNLLQSLVQKGVLTKEQADSMVKAAQDKAAADAAATAAATQQQEKEEANAVRVPYVPQIVKDEISKEVVAELGPSVKKEVVDEVTSKGSLFSALPDWVQRMRWSGGVRIRGEADNFANTNPAGLYLDYNQINSKGGREKAGNFVYLNTNEDQKRLRVRLLLGFDTDLGDGWSAGARLATGSTGEILATTNQTLGTYGSGYTITADVGYVRWTGETSTKRQIFTTTAGRFENPWISTDLVWYNDLTFEGVMANYRLNLFSDDSHRHDLFATVGAFPLSSFSVFDPNASNQQKWLLGGQVGADLHFENDSRIRLGAAYYDYSHVVGQRNTPQSTLLNWTAPAFVQKGNTLYDISNTTDPTVNLYGLAANYRIVDLIAVSDFHILPRYSVGFTAEGLKNIGFKSAEVMARYGSYVQPRTLGYRADLSFGSSNMGAFGTWRASVGYRYLQRDAVLDAFNDEDFHLGGTDTKGYTMTGDFSFNPRVFMRLKYMAANAIDGPPLTIDVWQLDLNTRF